MPLLQGGRETVIKQFYWRCADCGDRVQEIKVARLWDVGNNIGEYCECCEVWNPEVVRAYK